MAWCGQLEGEEDDEFCEFGWEGWLLVAEGEVA